MPKGGTAANEIAVGGQAHFIELVEGERGHREFGTEQIGRRRRERPPLGRQDGAAKVGVHLDLHLGSVSLDDQLALVGAGDLARSHGRPVPLEPP